MNTVFLKTILSSLHKRMSTVSGISTSLPSDFKTFTVNSVSPVTRTTSNESKISEQPVLDITSNFISYNPGIGKKIVDQTI